jgi:hypothetical protein
MSLDHEISGVSQQQGSGGSLTFTSQYGTVSVSSLPIVSVDGAPGNVACPLPTLDPARMFMESLTTGPVLENNQSHQRRFERAPGSSALPPIPDVSHRRLHVRSTPRPADEQG